jgi:hypothetical protein
LSFHESLPGHAGSRSGGITFSIFRSRSIHCSREWKTANIDTKHGFDNVYRPAQHSVMDHHLRYDYGPYIPLHLFVDKLDTHHKYDNIVVDIGFCRIDGQLACPLQMDEHVLKASA